MLKVKPPKFRKTFQFLEKLKNHDVRSVLDIYGKRGVSALSSATPVDSGESAGSWSYRIEGNRERYKLIWSNSAMGGKTPIVLLIQYGHATKSGGWFPGQDFINPALHSVYEDLNKALAEEVTG